MNNEKFYTIILKIFYNWNELTIVSNNLFHVKWINEYVFG